MRRALKLYEDFHSYEPREVGEFPDSFYIPDEATCVGDAKYVLYRSGKVDPATGIKPKRPVDYIHDHKEGVKVYRPRARKGTRRRVPNRITGCTELVLLGKCLGFAYFDKSGDEIEAHASSPYPELYCTPDGRCLLVIEDKRRVEALIWGGRLGVEDRGIVY